MTARGTLTAEDLIRFEADVAEIFNRGEIHAPVHLSGGNEQELIDIFAEVHPNDWVFSTWRSHYHALLHGVEPEWMIRDIRAGRSISLCYPERRFYSSAIVGGMLPIAVGVAWAAKKSGSGERAWVFVGDMAACSGMAGECIQYAEGHDLPITFVDEDNNLSVCTPTSRAWGELDLDSARVIEYKYSLKWPHSGAGKRVEF